MIERLLKVRFSYRQHFRRKGHRKAEEQLFCDDETVCIRELTVEEAPVAFCVFDHHGAGSNFVIRSHANGFWWPVRYNRPLTPQLFEELAANGDLSVVEALGAVEKYGRITFAEFEAENPIRDITKTTVNDERARVQRGASRTIFCDGRTYFEAGPPAFFRPYHKKQMVVGPLGLGDGDFGCDLLVRGPPRFVRSDCGGAGTAIGLDEIEIERTNLPDGLYAPEVGQTVETVRDLIRPGAAALFCEREFPKKLRDRLTSPYGHGPENAELFRAVAPELRNWLDTPYDPETNRWLLRRCAYADEKPFHYEFYYEAQAARSILRRLASHGIKDDVDEADDTALAELGAA
jgi:hypothetical protein